MKVLAIDFGFVTGFAVLGAGKAPASGSLEIKGSYADMGIAADDFLDKMDVLIREFAPTVIVTAEPFIHWDRRFCNPRVLGPLFGFDTLVQLAAQRWKIECYHANERGVRTFFLKGITRKEGESIKIAVQEACRLRKWNFCDEHAADALAVAAYALSVLSAKESEEAMPLAASIRR